MTAADPDATVFLIDDDPSVRDALSLQISLHKLRTAVFASAADFLAVYDPAWRGCLLTDLCMPQMSGLELQTALKERGCQLPVVILSAHGDVASTRGALKNGAVDFLEKPVDETVLLDVLGHALRLDAERRAISARRAHTNSLLESLTPRERAVLDLIADGLAHRDIAERLAISPRTVEIYKARMMAKLSCRTIADVVRFGLESRDTKNS